MNHQFNADFPRKLPASNGNRGGQPVCAVCGVATGREEECGFQEGYRGVARVVRNDGRRLRRYRLMMAQKAHHLRRKSTSHDTATWAPVVSVLYVKKIR